MNRLIQKITSYLALFALVVPMFTLAMPTGAQAAVSVVSGGSTATVVNGTQTPISLSDLIINSDIAGDFEVNNDIVIDIESDVPNDGITFYGTPTVTNTGTVFVENPVVNATQTKIVIDVTTASALDDKITIGNLSVGANSANAVEGNFRLRVTSGEPQRSAYSDSWSLFDAKNPALNITGPVNDSLVNEPPILFYSVEPGATVDVTLNETNLGAILSGTTLNNGIIQGENHLSISATDVAGNKITEYRTFKYDSEAAGYTVGANPDGMTVANDSTIVFEGTAEQSASVKLIIKDEGTDVVVKESGPFSRDNEKWRFDISATDIGAGFHDAYIEITDSAGNVNYQKIAHFGIASPVVKAANKTQGVYTAGSQTSGTSAYGTAPRDAVTPSGVSDETKEEIKDGVEDAAEGIIKAAETQDDSSTSPWQTVVTVIAILIIAIGVGTAGYYGYEWWATRSVAAVASTGPAENWDEPVAKKKAVRKTSTSKKSSRKKSSSRRSSSRW